MNKNRKLREERGKTINISPKSYEKIRRDADNAKPRRTLREQVNFINNISINE